ncbi:MAG: 4Fe-4S dicluster domain-containing protein [Candidatus Gastranaerophilales bacterium]|nr:4Fe-4S dicluster domain-containing protein [Candidatus Gastranaerophilales bacterium]
MDKNNDLIVNIDEKLATLRFICDNKSHIKLDIELCKKCKTKECAYFCPADVYNFENGNEIPTVDFENCLECGTCRICCPMNSLDWNYPKGGRGVRFRFG